MDIVTGKVFLENKQQHVTEQNEEVDDIVLEIIKTVQINGDRALYQYGKKFDSVVLDTLTVTDDEFLEAEQIVSESFVDAIQIAQKNITQFHQGQMEKSWFINKPDGVMLGQQVTAMDRVGIYIPGGKAAYPSTVLMNVIPAKLAGVGSIAIATPPRIDGKINPHVLVAAKQAGVDTVYKMGGAQAIAAFAYGTETIPKVDKITGPGNKYVARAKKWVFGDVAIDMIAGPSEICVVADDSAPIDFIAADLLSQAEHDEAATSICITFSDEQARQIQTEVQRQLQHLEREQIASASITNNGKIIVANSMSEAFELVNKIAPEHLQLMIQHATDYLPAIKHAGAIFLGNYSPEPLGDYVAGPNHTLPTSGTAKFASPLGVYDFMKKSSIIRYSEQALLKEAEDIETLAYMEGLGAHAQSIKLRREKG